MLKRLVCFALAVVLLTGCAAGGTPEQNSTELQTQQLYTPDTLEEQQTQGAIRVYPLERTDYTWLRPIGNHLLLASVGQTATLTVISGDAGNVGTSLTLGPELLGSFSTGLTGMYCYDMNAKSVVCYSAMLKKINEIPLPADMTGTPQIDPVTGEIYYCRGKDVLAYDPGTGITRLIRQHTFDSFELCEVKFDGAVLRCTAKDTEGRQHTLYLSTSDGKTLADDDGITQLDTWKDRYFAIRKEGILTQRIYGTLTSKVSTLNVEEGQLFSALELNGVVTHTDTQDATVLHFYDLTSGRKTAQVAVPVKFSLLSCVADEQSKCIWLLCAADEKQLLYRWDLQKTIIEEEAVYTGAFYSSVAPDTEGLKGCQTRVDALNKHFGVDIRIWNDAVKTPGLYTLEAEHQTAAIHKCLDELEQALAIYPENFLYHAVAKKIRICIVRSINGNSDSVQFWEGSDPYIVLAVGTDINDSFSKGMGYVVDSHILGNSSMVDLWHNLNPAGFTYGAEPNEDYLTGVDMAFLDIDSKTSVIEDRSRVFYWAMKPDCSQLFESMRMQAKLLQLCKAIRDAWRLEKKAEIYPWEQYLTKPINYVKK